MLLKQAGRQISEGTGADIQIDMFEKVRNLWHTIEKPTEFLRKNRKKIGWDNFFVEIS